MTIWRLAEKKLILASKSNTRAKILASARIDFTIDPAHIDEDEIKASGREEGYTPQDIAILLAEIKAQTVSQRHEDYVLGCDQLLCCEGRLFSKPKTLTAAHEQLTALGGRPHQLHTALVLFLNKQRIWHHHCVSTLTMRPLNQQEITQYLAAFSEQALASPGCYQIESGGVHLFSSMQGDYYDILGLPLLPLLGFLREHGLAAYCED